MSGCSNEVLLAFVVGMLAFPAALVVMIWFDIEFGRFTWKSEDQLRLELWRRNIRNPSKPEIEKPPFKFWNTAN